MAHIVTVGVTRLSMIMPVEQFPLAFSPYRQAPWIRCAVVGGAYNVASAVVRLGDTPRLCTTVGSDEAGQVIRRTLERVGLAGRGVVTVPESAKTVILVEPDGHVARSGWTGGSADYPMERFIEQAMGAELAVIACNPFGEPFLKVAKDLLKLPVATDLHACKDCDDLSRQPWLECADVIFRSHEGLSCSPQEWVADVLRRYPGCCIAVVGRGDQGCVMGLRDGRLVEIPAVAPRPVCSTDGAGDALFAAFLHGWLASGEPVEALESAVIFAGWKVGAESAADGFLTEGELAALRCVYPVRARVGAWR
ncbi:carbohydrate kinase family protein [Streptomyces sp. NBS 14/10]|uniref:carbohydrate kinase family protein n=1 Tax=Streptomyces sp. NBS 14/10 TaxID=1945643 RepID=UPI00211ADB7C|nr:carbohydrate kinase family protein [Streptomyces sp. NBS 14/10]KAK1178054.1 carbohydrate kinase family protein [Streptomyces sp. NBS 14/10]